MAWQQKRSKICSTLTSTLVRAGLIEGLAYLVERLALETNVTLPALKINPQAPTEPADDNDAADKDYVPGQEPKEDDTVVVADERASANIHASEDNVGSQEGPGRVLRSQGTALVTSQSLQAVATPSTADKKLNKAKRDTVLRPLVVSIADGVDLATRVERRDQLIRWMATAKAESTQRNQTISITFTADDRIQIPNFFFDQVMGAAGAGHLASLVAYYSHHFRGHADRGVGKRAAELAASDVSRPQVVREFFGTLSRQQAISHKNATLFMMLSQNVLNLDVLNHLNGMKELARTRDPELCGYLDSVDEGPEVGKGYAS